MRIKLAHFVVAIIFLLPALLTGQDDQRSVRPIFKPSMDDNTKCTTIGNIRLTITNFTTIGDGFVIQTPEDQPSCEYPRGSGIEHMFDGGLWVASVRDDGTIMATTEAMDIPFLIDIASGFEFTNSAEPDSFQTYFKLGLKMHEIDYVFTSTDTQIHLFNIKIHYLRFEEEIRQFCALELSHKRKSTI